MLILNYCWYTIILLESNLILIGGLYTCTWHSWGNWTPCSKSCAGGIRTQTAGGCSHRGAKNCKVCTKHCGPYKTLYADCNNICYNGGIYSSNKCSCLDEYYDDCCQKGLQTETLGLIIHVVQWKQAYVDVYIWLLGLDILIYNTIWATWPFSCISLICIVLTRLSFKAYK